MNELKADNTAILSLGKEVGIHRPADPKGPTKWKLVNHEWVPK